MASQSFTKLLEGEYTVKTHEVDFNQEMKISEVMNLLQDLATQHADLLDFGYEHLLKKNQFWVLSRLRIEISRRPKWKQNLAFKTWTNGLDGIFPLRNWQLFDKGNLILAGHAQWLILDGSTHRAIRPNKADFEGKTMDSIASTAPCKKLKTFTDGNLLAEYPTRISDLDMNKHVNNVNYFGWIMDSLGLEFATRYYPSVLEINFLKEIVHPATVEVKANADNTQFKLCTDNCKTLHCLISVNWKLR